MWICWLEVLTSAIWTRDAVLSVNELLDIVSDTLLAEPLLALAALFRIHHDIFAQNAVQQVAILI